MGCEIKSDMKLKCFEEMPKLQMEIDLNTEFKVEKHKWYYLTVDSLEKYHRMTLHDQSWSRFIEKPIVSDQPISFGNLNVNIGL